MFNYSLNKGFRCLLSKRFCDKINNSGPRVLRIINENNTRKIVYEDFNSLTKQQPRKISSRLKVFGVEKDDSIDQYNEEEGRYTEPTEENLIKREQFYSDYCRIYVKGGDGGKGCFSFDYGVLCDDKIPSGGNGGKGGDVVFVVDEDINSLSSLRKAHFKGNDGDAGKTKNKCGKDAKDIYVYLPLGTIVNEIVRPENYKHKKKDLKKNESYTIRFLTDLDSLGKKYIVCKGGMPGIGNYDTKTYDKGNKELRGKPGEEKELELILKTVADVCLVGYPNSGKSTLLAALTRAFPKIANYPFTTLFPHLGKLNFSDTTHVNIADLPGLIEGAHKNKGLGHKFLKHIERAKVILFVLDGTLDFNSKRSPLNDLVSLFDELKLFNPKLVEKPNFIALNKMDDVNYSQIYEANYNLLREKFPDKIIVQISAKEAMNLEELVKKIREFTVNLNSINKNL